MRNETKAKILNGLNNVVHMTVNVLFGLLALLLSIPAVILFTIIFALMFGLIATNASREHYEDKIEVKFHGKTKEIY
jgi:hypothetical protein